MKGRSSSSEGILLKLSSGPKLSTDDQIKTQVASCSVGDIYYSVMVHDAKRTALILIQMWSVCYNME